MDPNIQSHTHIFLSCCKVNMKDLLALFLIIAIVFYFTKTMREGYVECSKKAIDTGVFNYRTTSSAQLKKTP
jgi:hypothetical protein